MSTPKRAAKKTTTTKPAAKKPAAKKTSVKKIVKTAVKKAVKKTASTASKSAAVGTRHASSASAKAQTAAKKVVKKTTAAAKSATTKAQKVAKKIAKIISKVVAKKKSAAARTTHASSKKTAATKAATAVGTRHASSKAAPSGGAKKTARPQHAAAVTGRAKKPAAAAAAKKTPAPRRPKTFASPEVQHSFGFPADAPELPEGYGEDRLVLMTKDPEYLFAYWEVTPEKMSAGEKAKRRGEDYREALRLNWASRDIFERNFAVLPITLGARKWYLRVPFSGLAYQVEIGWLGESGHFVSLLTSNPSDAPESWNATRRRLKHAAESGDLLGRALAAGRPQGSSDLSSLVDTPEVSPTPIDWNFTGPGSQTSSFGKPGKANKAKTSGSRSAAS